MKVLLQLINVLCAMLMVGIAVGNLLGRGIGSTPLLVIIPIWVLSWLGMKAFDKRPSKTDGAISDSSRDPE